ncbi:MAG: YfiR family protein [Pirellulaceae bacterium]|nr:YfiR family protein [Pirellulaceae bacterium]MDP7014666.1 YfiR family protein [Pirellulaceae bacterium]
MDPKQKITGLRAGIATILAAAMLLAFPASSYAQNREYSIKAAYLYNLARYVTWPAGAFQNKTSPVVIGVVGENPFGNKLDKIAAKRKANGRSIIIQQFQRWAPACADCHILFVSKNDPAMTQAVVRASAGRPILVVGEVPGGAKQGAPVNFQMRPNTSIAIEINIGVVMRRQLQVNAKLLNLADIIKGN